MIRRKAPFVFLFLLPLACARSSIVRSDEEPRAVRVPGTGDYVWDEANGWMQPERGDWGAAEHIRSEAFRCYAAGAYADALAAFRALGRQEAGGKDANFYIAECYFHLGNYEKALEHYQLVYRHDFPAQNLVDQALQRVFTIGMAYLKGEAVCDFLGMIKYSCPDHGIEILADPSDGLITEFPNLSFADDALIEIARHYHRNGEYPEAVPLYDRVASDPESEWADFAAFQAAMATFQQVRGVDYDQRILQEAERRFRRYLENYPRGNHAAEAREKRLEISDMEGAKYLRIAKFYLQESQPAACEFYLRRVLEHHPLSTAAREAREIQKQLDRIREGGGS